MRCARWRCSPCWRVSVVLAVGLDVAWPRSLLLGAVLLLPLALPLPGILRAQRRTFAWATLCVTPYFVYGSPNSWRTRRCATLAATMLLASLGSSARWSRTCG